MGLLQNVLASESTESLRESLRRYHKAVREDRALMPEQRRAFTSLMASIAAELLRRGAEA